MASQVVYLLLIASTVLGVLIGWFLHQLKSASLVSAFQESLDLKEKELGVLTLECREKEAKYSRLEYESSHVVKQLNRSGAALEKSYIKLKKNNHRLQEQNQDVARKITQLYQVKQSEISELQSKIDVAKAVGVVPQTSTEEIHVLKKTVDRLESLLLKESASYEDKIDLLEQRLCQFQPLDVMQSAQKVVADDLTKIVGIGPKISEFLREFGIVSFQQLANMTDAEMARLGEELGDFSDRIVRDRWVEQAAHLSQLSR